MNYINNKKLSMKWIYYFKEKKIKSLKIYKKNLKKKNFNTNLRIKMKTIN